MVAKCLEELCFSFSCWTLIANHGLCAGGEDHISLSSFVGKFAWTLNSNKEKKKGFLPFGEVFFFFFFSHHQSTGCLSSYLAVLRTGLLSNILWHSVWRFQWCLTGLSRQSSPWLVYIISHWWRCRSEFSYSPSSSPASSSIPPPSPTYQLTAPWFAVYSTAGFVRHLHFFEVCLSSNSSLNFTVSHLFCCCSDYAFLWCCVEILLFLWFSCQDF